MPYKIFFVFVLLLINNGECADFKQERAKILYYNPKYTKDISILTSREGRRSPYLTSLNATITVPFGNNVTWQFEFSSPILSTFPLRVDFKICEGISKFDWLREWITASSNIPLNDCPIPPGAYYMRKVEFPPKNFPLKFSNADYFVKMNVFLTSTKEKILDAAIDLKSSGTSKKG